MKKLIAMLFAVGTTLGVRAGAITLADWESAMGVNRPHLSAKETRSPRTLAAMSLVKNSGRPFDEIAGRTLGMAYVRSSEWESVFLSDEESVDVCALAMDGKAVGRFAVYGQLGNLTPYYWIVEGLDVGRACTLAEFLESQCIMEENSSVSAVDGVLCADDIDVFMQEESVSVPYENFYFAFVDDLPGANWAHPCRYVFVSEDFSGFTVLYKNWSPSIVLKGTQKSIPLVRLGDAAECRYETLDEVKARVYGYARGLESNGISYNAGDKGRSYFVLVSGGADANSNGIRFWSDTAMLYSTLTKKYGVDKDHIYVYVSDGNSTGDDANLGDDSSPVLVDSPKDLDGDGVGDVTGPANKNNLKQCMASLKKTLTENDQLLIFMTSHGSSDGVSGSNNYDCMISLFGSSMRDDELADMAKDFSCPVAVAVECCYSGGFVDDICATANRAIATACNHYEVSWGYGGGGAWTDDSPGKTGSCNCWAAPLNAAFRGFWPKPCKGGGYPWQDSGAVYPDSNGDGFVSFAEAAIFARENDFTSKEHPQYETSNGIGDGFFILNRFSYETAEKSVLLDSAGIMEGKCELSGRGDAWRLCEAAPSWIKSCSLSDANGNVLALTHDASVEVSGSLSLDVVADENASYEVGRACVIKIYNETLDRIEYAINISQKARDVIYTVTLNPGVNGVGEMCTVEKTKGMPVALPGEIFARAGFRQTGWSAVEGGDKLYALSATYADDASITLYPYWTGNSYTIRFDRQGGIAGTSSVVVRAGSLPPSIVVPRRSGYAFVGYFSAADGLGKRYYDEDGAGVELWDIAEKTTLYAKWSPLAYDVELDLQGGSGVTGVTAHYGCQMPQITAPLRAGYVFLGFFRAGNGAGFQYYNADGTSVRAWDKTGSATLYASWRPVVYAVTLHLQDGTGETYVVNVTYESAMPSIVPPVRSGFIFLGYYTAADDSGEMVYDMSGNSSNVWCNAGDGVLYAHWMACGFSSGEISACEGSAAEIRVVGGDAKTNSSVEVWLTYNTAAAADLDFANATIDCETPKGGLKFPLTLTWEAGEVGEKFITIPTKADKTVEDDEFFTLQLAEPVGMELGEERVCTVTIHDPGYDDLEAKIKSDTATKAEQTAWDKLQNAGAPYVRGLADPANAGKVTGSGLCAEGKKVTLNAIANKGFVFHGWVADASETRPYQEGKFVATTPSLVIDRTAKPAKDTPTSTTIVGGAEDATYYAEFITVDEDKGAISLSVNDGLSLDQTASPALSTNVTTGVYLEWPVAADALTATTIKVAGLPAGLKFTDKPVTSKVGTGKSAVMVTNVPANTIYGAPTAAKTSDVKITVTTAGKSSVVYLVKLTVDPLPSWAVGNFEGAVEEVTGNGERGTATMTIATSGKVAGKFSLGGTNWTFKADSYSAASETVGATNFVVSAVATAGKATMPVELALSGLAIDYLPASATARAAGMFGDAVAELYRLVWTDKGDADAASLATGYAGAYSFAAAYGDLEGDVTFTLNEKGAVKGAAAFPDGAKTRKVTFAANALSEEDGLHVVVAIPADAKKGWPAVFEDRVLVAKSKEGDDIHAYRDPGAIVSTEELKEGSGASGTVIVSPKYGQVAAGKTVTLTAKADKGSVFSCWEIVGVDTTGLDLSSPTLKYPSPASGDVTATAKFVTVEDDKDNIRLSLGGELPKPSVSEPVSLATNVTCGVALNWPLEAGALSATTVKVAGLPAGLKFDAKSSAISGAPTAAKTSDVKITVTTAGKSSVTYLVKLTVDPLPAWAVGSFEGSAGEGSATMSVTTAGNVSGKFSLGGTNWTFKADSYAAVEFPGETTNFVVSAVATAGKATMPVELTLSSLALGYLPASAASCAVGTFGDADAALYRIVWTDKGDADAAAYVASYAGAYSFVAAYGELYGGVTFTLNEKGAISGAAVLPDGAKTRKVTFAANALAEPDGLHIVVALPPDAKKGYPPVFEDRVLIPWSGVADDDHVYRDPGAIVSTEELNKGSGASGTVTVSPKYGQVAAGKPVTLTAKADKGSVFSCWEIEGVDMTDLDLSAATLKYPSPASGDVTATAKFVTVEEDIASLTLALPDAAAASDGTCDVDLGACVESLSIPKLTVSGLPAGLKYDAKTMKITGKATKPGVYTVTVKATNTSATGKDAKTATFKITVPNFECEALPNLDPATNAYGILTAGVAISADLVDCTPADGWTVKVAGLPAGLKYDTKTGKITGTPTAKAGSYTVTFTATKKGEPNQVATITLNVEPLPDWVVGTFYGLVNCYGDDGSWENTSAAEITISSNGKVTVCSREANNYLWKNVTSLYVNDSGVYCFDVLHEKGVEWWQQHCEIYAEPALEGGPLLGCIVGEEEGVDCDEDAYTSDWDAIQDAYVAKPAGLPLPKFSDKDARRKFNVHAASSRFAWRVEDGVLVLKFGTNGIVTPTWTGNAQFKMLAAHLTPYSVDDEGAVSAKLLVQGVDRAKERAMGLYFDLVIPCDAEGNANASEVNFSLETAIMDDY